MCDLDHFKSVNDKYGHEAGDAALVTVATVLRGALRDSDALGRWGGEEFIALLPATDGPGAGEVAERMRMAIEKTLFEGISEGITISAGVSTATPVDDPEGSWDRWSRPPTSICIARNAKAETASSPARRHSRFYSENGPFSRG